MTPDTTPDSPTASSPPPSRPPRGRWWQVALSLRVLMVLVLVIGGVLGWQARRASLQRRAVAQIQEAGGSVIFDFQAPEGKPWQVGASPPGPAWLRRIVGDEPFQSPRWTIIDDSGPQGIEPTDDTITALANLNGLENLNIYNSQLNDAQFARLAGLGRIKNLTLQGNKLTAACLAQMTQYPYLERLTFRLDHDEPAATLIPMVAGLTQLKELSLTFLNPITVADLEPLRRLTQLEALYLLQSPADEACLDALSGLTHLQRVDLRSTQVTDAGLRRLSGLRDITSFIVNGTAITDEGLALIAAWPKLATLHLNDQQPDPTTLVRPLRTGHLTDRGLKSLGKFADLRTVAIGGRFTDAGLVELARCPKIDFLELNGIEASFAGMQALLTGHQFRILAFSGPTVADTWASLLAGQTRLQTLSLVGPGVTDAALASLPLAALRQLGLPNTRLTDAGLRTIAAGSAALRFLDVRGTAVTPAGVAAFRRLLPQCEVEADPNPPGR